MDVYVHVPALFFLLLRSEVCQHRCTRPLPCLLHAGNSPSRRRELTPGGAVGGSISTARRERLRLRNIS